MQIRALAQRRIAIDRFDQAVSDRLGVEAEEPGKLPHAFAVSKPDDDRTSIRWHPH